VETGKAKAEAIITVIAADSATQYALIWSNLVISFQTVFINLQPKTAKPTERESAQSNIIQVGIHTFQIDSQVVVTDSYIAANGQIALATSFAQCAKLSKHTAKIKGTLNKVFTKFLLSSKYFFFLLL